MPSLYPHIDQVFLAVINKGNNPVVLQNAIDGNTRLVFTHSPLQDAYMIDGFPVSVMHLEDLPIRRETRLEIQFVYFKLEPKQ